jgi:hypothetical protein
MDEQVAGTGTEWVQTNGRTSMNEHKRVGTKAKRARTHPNEQMNGGTSMDVRTNERKQGRTMNANKGE